MGLEGGTAVFSLLGMVGIGFMIAGRYRTGTWIMAISATGVATSVATFTLIRPRLLYPLGEPGYPLSPGSYVVHLFPVLLLLMGAGLSFLASRMEG